MGSLREGAKQVVEVCLGLRENEKITIITDRATLKIGKALENAARKITNSTELFVLEDFGNRPLQKVPKKIENSIKQSNTSILAIKKIENEVHTVRKPIRLLGIKYGRCVTMPGVTERVFETGLSVNYREVWKFSDKIFNIVKTCREIRIKSESGTDLILRFSPKYRWINSKGDMRKKGHTGTNLPGAEVYTYPERVEGIFVADVEMGDYFTEKYGFLEKTPVLLHIKNGRVTSITCENSGLQKELEEYMRKDSNANRIGEFALGTNPFLKDYIGVFLQDEKVPGVHIALGNPYPEETGAPYKSQAHLDCITGKASVWVDGKKIMERGSYVI